MVIDCGRNRRIGSALLFLIASACQAATVDDVEGDLDSGEELPADRRDAGTKPRDSAGTIPDGSGSGGADGQTADSAIRDSAGGETATSMGDGAPDRSDTFGDTPSAGDTAAARDTGADAMGPTAPPVFDLTVLHDIKIVVEDKYLAQLDSDRVNRVPATFTYDGQTLTRVGIRKKGTYGSYTTLSGKPAFSVDFEEFVPNQHIQGFDKLALNNCRQDPTLLAEHTGYELYRRAKLAGPLTAHAVVTFNGAVKGIYVVNEATNKGFLRRNFGKGNDEGNLYEAPSDIDFVNNAAKMELKREVEEKRSRADIHAVAAAINNTAPAQFESVVGPLFDIPAFITAYAIDGIVNHWDSYPFNGNNYYIYHRPTDNRFVMIPHGMDSLFRLEMIFTSIFANGKGLIDVYWTAAPPSTACRACGLDGVLGRRVRAVPALDTKYRAEVQRVLREVLDLPSMFARWDQVGKLIHNTTYKNSAVVRDVGKFDEYIGAAKKFLTDRRAALLK